MAGYTQKSPMATLRRRESVRTRKSGRGRRGSPLRRREWLGATLRRREWLGVDGYAQKSLRATLRRRECLGVADGDAETMGIGWERAEVAMGDVDAR